MDWGSEKAVLLDGVTVNEAELPAGLCAALPGRRSIEACGLEDRALVQWQVPVSRAPADGNMFNDSNQNVCNDCIPAFV
jgi:hypothetical protein